MSDLFANMNFPVWLSTMKQHVADFYDHHYVGEYLPGTNKSEMAAQFLADVADYGQKRGGIAGYLMEIYAWRYGLLFSLWTKETAGSTAITIGTWGLGSAAAAGKLGAASLPVLKGMAVWGSFQGGLSLGEGATGQDLGGEKLSQMERGIDLAAGLFTFITILGQIKSPIFGRGGQFGRGPGKPPGMLNTGDKVRVGWSFRDPNLAGGGESYFALHGGGDSRAVPGLTLPKWHHYLNRFGWPSGPTPAPGWAINSVTAMQVIGVIMSGAYGYELGTQYFDNGHK
jgi:hypothetical protein